MLEQAAKVGLSFATNKSELVHCLPESSRNKTMPLDILPTLMIENRTKSFTIQPTRTIKQLGVIIDGSLNLCQACCIKMNAKSRTTPFP
jgi:hypothetical protein